MDVDGVLAGSFPPLRWLTGVAPAADGGSRAPLRRFGAWKDKTTHQEGAQYLKEVNEQEREGRGVLYTPYCNLDSIGKRSSG